MEKVIEHFNSRAVNYNNALWVTAEEINDNILKLIGYSGNLRIIDIGAGTGVTLSAIASKLDISNEYVALDSSIEMLNQIVEENIVKKVADAHYLPFPDNSFDFVIAKQSLHYMNDLNKVLSEIHRVLKPLGSFIIGQIMPYSAVDQNYWQEIIKIRQPLRINYLNFGTIINDLLNNKFYIETSNSFKVKESLQDWLNRYQNIDKSDYDTILNLFNNAPDYYCKLYDFQNVDNDIIFNNCWYLIKANAIK